MPIYLGIIRIVVIWYNYSPVLIICCSQILRYLFLSRGILSDYIGSCSTMNFLVSI